MVTRTPMRVVRLWQRLTRLSWCERGLLIQALLLLPLTAIVVRVLGFQRWHVFLVRLAPVRAAMDDQSPESRLARAHRAARIVDAASRGGPYRANCLQLSTTLWWLLRRQGIRAIIRIGSRKYEGKFQAHAWVELDGVVLNDAADVAREFAPFGAVEPPQE